MKTFMEQAKLYAVYHQKALNRYIQMLGISLIFLALMTILACIHISIPGFLNVDLACIATLVLIVYYIRLNWLLGLTITPLLVFLCWLAGTFSNPIPTAFTIWMFLISLVVGVVVCFTGYFVEGKRPAFKDSLHPLVIAPLMMAAEIFFIAGRQRALKDDIYGKDVH